MQKNNPKPAMQTAETMKKMKKKTSEEKQAATWTFLTGHLLAV